MRNENIMQNNFHFLLGILLVLAAGCTQSSGQKDSTPDVSQTRPEYALVIHGGAGGIRKENMSPERELAYTRALNEALDIGEAILQEGGTALDAVEQTIVHLEDSPLFNAGRGAVFTADSTNELDASIMDGRDRTAGAVGSVTTVKNPIRAARAVMEQSPHVLLTSAGAEAFAQNQGLELVAPAYFRTERSWKALERAKARELGNGGRNPVPSAEKFGTVGCAALDRNGHLAAGTSTGGMTNKKWNRLGDSPIIGAGTYADDGTCAVSCTGHGEFFIRYAVAYDMSALMVYKGLSVQAAGDFIVHEKLKKAGGDGGLIALDAQGNIAMPFNTAGMYRGYARPGERVVAMYEE